MELWWTTLDTAHKVFYTIAIATSVVLVLQLILTVLGLDGHGDVDTDVGDVDADMGGIDHHDTGVGVLSVRTIVAFFTGFGWGGVAALESGSGLIASILIALLCGGILMSAVFFLMRGLYGLRYSGTLDYRNAVGRAGSVYLPIPAGMEGPGQIEVLVQGRLCVVRAFTRAPQRIANHARVRVVDVLDQQTLLVEPLDPAPAIAASPASPQSQEG